MSATTATPETGARPDPAGGLPRPLRVAAWLAVALLAVLVLAGALFELQGTTRSAFDAHALLQIAERSRALGEPYYVAGADLKGPLWIAGYDLALRLSNPTMVWYATGALIMVVGATTAAFVFRIAAAAGTARWTAAGICVALFVWITTGPEEYASTLYSRNWIALLLTATVAALAALPRTSGRRQLAIALLAGVTTGVAVQTNISSAPTAGVMALAMLWLVLPRGAVRGQWRLLAAFVLGAVGGLGSVFVYYAIRGGLHDFAWYWWSFSRDYASKTDRTGFGILQKGWDDFALYYRARPMLPLVLGLFVADLWRRARARETVWLDVLLVAWWLSECFVVAISQRFFGHYLILPLLPIAVMGAVLAARHGHRLPRAAQLAAPVALGFLALWFGNWTTWRAGLDQALRFDPPGKVALGTDALMNPANLEARANILRFVPPRPYGLVWTPQSSDLTDLNLRSATRYVPRVWLTGEVPGFPAADLSVVPDAVRERFWADLRQTPPEIIAYHPGDLEFAEGTPLRHFQDCGFVQRWASATWVIYQRVRPIDGCVPAKFRGGAS